MEFTRKRHGTLIKTLVRDLTNCPPGEPKRTAVEKAVAKAMGFRSHNALVAALDLEYQEKTASAAEAKSSPVHKEYAVYHNTTCECCGSDLTKKAAVKVIFSDGNQVTNSLRSQVCADGRLLDPNGQVGKGMHSCTECSVCGEMLDEMLEDTK